MTGPRPDTSGAQGTDPQGLANLPRILSPDEYQQARMLSPTQLGQAKFPVLPPPFAPKDAVKTLDPNAQPDKGTPLTGLGRILTKYVAQPIMEHPLTSAAIATVPGAGYLMSGLMGKDVLEYASQKAAELSLPPDVRKMAEADPTRIPGEQAAVEAVMLGAAPAIHAGLKAAGSAADVSGGMVEAGAKGVRDMQGPMRQAIDNHVTSITDAWQKVFAPANRIGKTEVVAPGDIPQAKQAANIIRATTGQAAGSYEQAAFKLDEFRRAIEPLPEADKLGFIDAIEGGKSQASPEFQKAADVIRATLDGARDQIRALGTGKLENFIKDYFPHIWTDPERAMEAFKNAQDEGLATGGPNPLPETDPAAAAAQRAAIGGKRPMAGSGAFLKQRSIPTTAEGMALGLMPVSTNPVDLTLLKLREMNRYLMAHQSLNELKDAGLVKFVASGEQAPDGYARIDDKIATVFGPREGAVTLPEGANIDPPQVGVPGMRIMGEHWAPETVATVVNNYLSPGLRGNAIYDAYRGLGNSLNQAQLGLSAFHLGFTTLDASVSRAALGVEHIAAGRPLTGLADLISSPAAGVQGVLQGTIGDLSNHLLGTNFQWGLGAKIRDAYLQPENASPEIQALANAVKEAGGRIKTDSFYKNSAPEKMIEAWRAGEYGKATAFSLPAALEYAAKPIMEHIVPLQKLGIFGDMAKKAMADLPPEATLADHHRALSSAWDSVDNRMGQLVYDNLFWNKTFKDLAMGSVRSVGWNLGTIRELGGGLSDIAGAVKDAAQGNMGDPAAMTHKAAYAVALPLTVGLYGAVYQYLRTGQGPQELKDYFYPKTGEQDPDGNDERVQLPSYMKDVAAYKGAPWETVKHKMSPILSAIGDMLNNEDFFGDEIRNPNDPAVQQIMQEATYIATSATPFSIRNSQESAARGDQSAVTKFGNWFGVTPAPRHVVRSDAQNMMADMQTHTTGRTPEAAEAAQTRREVLGALRTQGTDPGELQQKVSDAIERHQLTPPDVVKLLKRAGMTPAQEKFKSLSLEQAVQVFKIATPREQALFAEALVKKVDAAVKKGATP